MGRHARAALESDPERPHRLDAVDIGDLGAIEHREIAGLPNGGRDLLQEVVPQRRGWLIGEDREGEPGGARRELEAPSVRRALQEARGRQRVEPAMQRRPRRVRARRDVRERHRMIHRGHAFEQGERLQPAREIVIHSRIIYTKISDFEMFSIIFHTNIAFWL